MVREFEPARGGLRSVGRSRRGERMQHKIRLSSAKLVQTHVESDSRGSMRTSNEHAVFDLSKTPVLALAQYVVL